MAKQIKGLEPHLERLATTDEYGHRVYVHPEDVKGKFKDLRTKVYWFLIALYLALPWIHINGRQIIQMNLGQREFFFFGATFYGHDAPLLFFIFVGVAFFFAFITSLLGRVWCGWACPQTVFIDAIFRQIEKLVEGKSRDRRELDRAPWSLAKLFKRSLKWFLYALVSLHIAHSFIGYFVGTHELFAMSLQGPSENFETFLTMLIASGIILFDFGWFKEQFCIIACPYGRFQSVMMDSHSPVVAYDTARGEPRRTPDTPKDSEGDCINCFHCVKVCPTGIDIRRGTQMECIACTMCIDACDNIMTKLKRPKGLIRYATEESLNGRKTKWARPRVIFYLAILVGIFVTFYYTLSQKNALEAFLIRGNKAQYQEIKTNAGKIFVNHYKIHFNNSSHINYKLYFELNSKLNSQQTREEIKIVTPKRPFQVGKGLKFANIFFRFKKDILIKGSHKIYLDIVQKGPSQAGPVGKKADRENGTKLLFTKEVNLVGPF